MIRFVSRLQNVVGVVVEKSPVYIPGIVLIVAIMPLAFPPNAFAVGEKHALVIGLNDYIATIDGLPPLTFASNDAQAVADELQNKGFNVISLINHHAKREDILLQLVKYARALDAEDTLLIYFAGHGVRQTYGGRSYSYWMTHDALLPRLEVEGIRLNHLLEYVMDIPTKRRIVILDHCHSGSIDFTQALSGSGRDGLSDLRIRRDVFSLDNFRDSVAAAVNEGIVILGAATDTAYEYADLKHGVFTYTFLEALTTNKADTNGNGILSTDELRTHVINRTTDIATNRSSVQNPIEFVSGSPSWDLVLLGSTPQKLLDQLAEHLDTDIELRVDEALERVDDGSATSIDLAIVSELRELAVTEGSIRSKARSISRSVRRLQP